MTPEPWYADGLRFACTRCGNCCTGEPGTVFVSEAEIEALRKHLDLTGEAFRTIHTRTLSSGAVVLRERQNYDCTFWREDEGCTVYAWRPRQCRTWPFWQNNVATPQAWKEVRSGCPGAGDGPLHDLASIRAATEEDGTLSAEVRAGRIVPNVR